MALPTPKKLAFTSPTRSASASTVGLNISKMETPPYSAYDVVSLDNTAEFVLLAADDDAEVRQLFEPVPPKVYCRRWFIVLVVFAAGFAQTTMWNFYSPISRACKQLFGWSDPQFAWLLNASNITFVLVGTAWPWVIDRWGLRFALTASIALLAASALLRCVPYGGNGAVHYRWLIASMILNGIAAPCLSLIPPVVSAAWFPLRERATATSLLVASIYFGVTSGFLIGPNVVRALDPRVLGARNATSDDLEVARNELSYLYYAEAAATVVLLLLALVVLRSRPPTAPTRSASEPRTAFFAGLRDLVCRGCTKKLLLFTALGSALCAPIGVYAGFSSVLDLYFADFGISAQKSAMLGCWSSLAGSVAAVLMGVLADRFAKRMKWIVLGMYFGATVCFLWFALLGARVLPFSIWQLYVSFIGGGMFLNGAIPLFFELVVEVTFPIGEATTAGTMMLLSNLIQVLWLLVPMDQVGTSWMAWAVAAVTPLFAAVLLPLRFSGLRRVLDHGAPGEEGEAAVVDF